MLLGGSASDMHKTYKQNKALGSRKKSLKDRTENYRDTKPGKKLEYGKMTSEEYAEFKKELSIRKKKDQQKMLAFYSVIGLITISIIAVLKSYLGF